MPLCRRAFWITLIAFAFACGAPALAAPAPAGGEAQSAQPSRADLRRDARLAARRGRDMRTIYDQPQIQQRETGGRTVRLARNAILAEERYLIPSLRKALDSDVTIGAPFRIRFRAGDLLLVRAGDPARSNCLLPYPVPRDEQGIAYPDVCLIDADGDGRYELARFQPENPDKRARDFPIAPVALRTLPPADELALSSWVATQRLRVDRVGRDRATIVVESLLVPSGPFRQLEPGDVTEFPELRSVPAGSRDTVLRLAEGATARVAGLQMRAERDPSGAWSVVTSGQFDDWLVLSDGNTQIDAGSVTMSAQ